MRRPLARASFAILGRHRSAGRTGAGRGKAVRYVVFFNKLAGGIVVGGLFDGVDLFLLFGEELAQVVLCPCKLLMQ